MNRPFSKTSYIQNNSKGINASIALLNQAGLKTISTAEAYSSHDFIVGAGTVKLKIESEVSNIWKTTQWPYEDVTMPYRKHKSQSDLYIMVNKEASSAIVCDMNTVKSSPVKEKWVYSSNMTEAFFFCPVENFDLYVKGTDGKWVLQKNNRGVIQRSYAPLGASCHSLTRL